MTGYLISFTVYTAAMIGVICLAFFVFKTFSGGGFIKKSGNMNIEDSMKLSTRKTLYIINVQGERFLIASDLDSTTLISKLEKKDEKVMLKEQKQKALDVCYPRTDKSLELKSFDGIESLDEFASIIDFQKKREHKGPMMRELAKKLNTISR